MIDPLPFITAAELRYVPNVSHGFFGRRGGVSAAPYNTLNAGPGSGDRPQNVTENRRRIASAVGVIDEHHLLSAYQIHSASAVFVDKPFSPQERPCCDALVTSRPGIALCALAADCAPVLLADPESGVIASVHAGWRGAVAGVIEAAIDLMEQQGSRVQNTVAAVGPCISQSSYEVGPEFRDTFLSAAPWSEQFFEPGREDRLQFDLKSFCEQILVRAGINRVDVIQDDTLTQSDTYFSNRYSAQNGLSDYGRNASVIALSG